MLSGDAANTNVVVFGWPDTLSWFRVNQSLPLLLNAACLAEKLQIPILKSLVWPGPTIYRTWVKLAYYYTNDVVFFFFFLSHLCQCNIRFKRSRNRYSISRHKWFIIPTVYSNSNSRRICYKREVFFLSHIQY